MIQLQITLKTYKPDNFKTINHLITKLKKIKIFKDIEFKQIVLPSSKKKIFTVLKSPHVYKKSREQFKYSTYKRQVLITNNTNQNTLLLYLDTFFKKYLSKIFYIQSKIKKCL